MAGTSQIVLMNVKDPMESAISTILSSSCGIVNTYISREDESMATPSVAVTFEEVSTPFHPYFSASNVVNDAWAGNLAVTVGTDRSINAVSHSSYTYNIINTIGNMPLINNSGLLPHHIINWLVYNGTSTETNEDYNMDFSTVMFTYYGQINPASW